MASPLCRDQGHDEVTENVTDLTKLNQITLANVLRCLIERFKRKEFCTFAGSVLVALNPCSSNSNTSSIGRNDDVKKFIRLLSNGNLDFRNLEPHILTFGVRSLYNINHTHNDQVIVVSGDSGAGKTTCTQDLIKFFTYSDHHCENTEDVTLEHKIYEATVILEALGNASTAANPNSSRFGRLVQLHFSKDQKIISAEIKTYLLEKHRVAKGNHGERNFHIFHYFFQAFLMYEDNQFLKSEVKLNISQSILQAVINKSFRGYNEEVFKAEFWNNKELASDYDNFLKLGTALIALDLLDELFTYVFDFLFGICHLLAIKFVSKEDNKENFEDFSAKFVVSEETQLHLSYASQYLGLKESEDLLNSLVFNTVSAGNRQSLNRSPCLRIEDCESRLHSLISCLYEKLFHHVVEKLNCLLKTQSAASQSNPVSTVSILDLYGFENLGFNHLEQLCINYANECIQEVQISVLKSYFEEEKRLADTVIVFDEPRELNRVKEDTCLRLDEIHNSLFRILNDACLIKRIQGMDEQIFEQLREETKNEKFITAGNKHDSNYQFVIRHYASDVKYSLKGMIMKNKDFIPEDFISLLSRSEKSFVSNLFPRKYEIGVQSSGRKTILMRFKASVTELVSELSDNENRDVHFIKCIRPNRDLTQDLVHEGIIQSQLHACGIVDVIKIAGNGYPIRLSTLKFQQTFQGVTRYFCGSSSFQPEKLVKIFTFGNSCLKFGQSLVFLNEGAWTRLNNFNSFLENRAAKRIQSAWGIHLRKFQAKREKTPVPLQSSSPNCSLYYTPMTSLSNNVSFLTAGPSCDSSFSLWSSRQSDDDNEPSEPTLADLSINDGESVSPIEGSNSDCWDLTLSADTLISESKQVPLFYGNGVVSKSAVHSLPIKFYVRKNVLGVKQPKRLIANGIEDAFEDYGIIMEPRNSSE